eukprot:CAMPEP_0168419624 /NCGR_PEP_ID=MMETSP0228-20121227/32362_1 /TAXON_ID=133427 /ORGANISM="Protoceratium reticulatum, Strain CCCM 535 (=CCMP 1889)" /LENGTH=47 /DNA_ID= /DNA_START= /DNA_END= /DNA_ORIENTATION=
MHAGAEHRPSNGGDAVGSVGGRCADSSPSPTCHSVQSSANVPLVQGG